MLLFRHRYKGFSYFYGEMPSGTRTTTEAHVIPSSRAQQDEDKGETSSLAAFKSNYEKLPHYLKSCLDYCYVVSKNFYTGVSKGDVVRLLLAQGLIPERPGEIMEDTAENIINELIGLEMLHELYLFHSQIKVSVPFGYEKSCLLEVEEQDFVSKAADSPIHACITNYGEDLPPNFKSLLIRSLIINFSFPWRWQTICGLQFLLVLKLMPRVEYLHDEVGDLVHLKYLCLNCCNMKTLPRTIANLQKLQTLHLVNCSKLFQVPVEIYNIKQLRHLLFVDRCVYSYGIRVPRGIGTLANLHTCTGVYAGAGIASELSSLTQLRKLDVQVSDDHAGELFASIIKLENLVSLSLTAEQPWSVTLLPELEPFSPPPHLQELILCGGLVEMPNWLPSVENLTFLGLYHSNLLEEPSSVLQYLPKLKHLTLWEAYKAKLIGKEFCDVGGFPELESLIIASENLVEWTEIVNGAFPSLRYLRFYCCDKLRFLPEGLQNISTIQELYVEDLHSDLGKENYKIKHISKFHWDEEIF